MPYSSVQWQRERFRSMLFWGSAEFVKLQFELPVGERVHRPAKAQTRRLMSVYRFSGEWEKLVTTVRPTGGRQCKRLAGDKESMFPSRRRRVRLQLAKTERSAEFVENARGI